MVFLRNSRVATAETTKSCSSTENPSTSFADNSHQARQSAWLMRYQREKMSSSGFDIMMAPAYRGQNTRSKESSNDDELLQLNKLQVFP